jgi:hypothetical protein
MREDLLRLAMNAPVNLPKLRKIKSDAGHAYDEDLETLFKSISVDLIHQNLPMCCWIDTVFRIIGTVDWDNLCTGGADMPLPGELSDKDL